MEKQIEEIAKIIGSLCDTDEKPCELCELRNKDGDDYRCFHLFAATALYNAGYRKQSEGEWIWTENGEADYEKYWVCSVCKEHDFVKTKFCSNCGAKMKGAEDAKAD